MSAQLIDGKAIAAKFKAEIRDQVEHMRARGLRRPGLAVIMVGDNPASAVYVRNKRKACAESGIHSVAHDLPYSTTQAELVQLIESLNRDPAIDGILVQLPLPQHIEQSLIIEKIDPTKDVDGFHPFNVGRLALRVPLIRPCTPYGVTKLIEHVGISPKGRHCVVVGASNIVGRPMALELLLMGGTVTVCHRFTGELEPYVEQRRHPRRRGRPSRHHPRRMDQAGQRRHRRRHEPLARRQARRRRRLRRRHEARGLDHAGSRRRRADDGRDADEEHARSGGRAPRALDDQARRHCVTPPGLSSMRTPAAASCSRIRSPSAKFFAARAARRASTSASMSRSASAEAPAPRFK